MRLTPTTLLLVASILTAGTAFAASDPASVDAQESFGARLEKGSLVGSELAGTQSCGGLAPLAAPGCTRSFYAGSYIQTTIDCSGVFTGQIRIEYYGPFNSRKTVVAECIAGGILGSLSSTGGLYAGQIAVSVFIKGPYGNLGANGASGFWEVTFNYA